MQLYESTKKKEKRCWFIVYQMECDKVVLPMDGEVGVFRSKGTGGVCGILGTGGRCGSKGIQGGSPLTPGFEASKLSIFRPCLIFP